MLTFTLLTVFAVLLVSVDVVHGESSSACYGTQPCDFFSMQCPSNQVIKLNNLYAGYKNTTIYPICGNADRHCESAATCCSYALGGNDILELLTLENIYHTYTNCSGRQSCTDIQANWQLLEATDNNGDLIYSSFVQLEYDCEEASSKIPFCGGTTGTNTGIYSYAEIMFDGSMEKFDPAKASKDCLCTVTNRGSQQNVIFKTIDVRLESHQKGLNQSVANCSSAFFLSSVLAAQCQPTDQHYRYSFYNSKQETIVMPAGTVSEISLTGLHEKGALDSPAMVWISLKAEVNNGIQVTCKETESADLTTTPTTTTTTTTTEPTTTTPTTTTTKATTTPKPTTTTPKPTTTTTPQPTTTTPKPTTTTPKPTTTTPKPTTTTPKPTTTTTKPTTTTPKPTTTTTTFKPTTTSKPAATTTKPPPTTTQKPTTTTIIKKTTTPKSTTLSTIITSFIPPRTTTVYIPPTTTDYEEETTIPIPIEGGGDGEKDNEQRLAVYLAIIVPIIVCLLLITALLLWIYWKRTTPRRRKFHFMKDTPRSQVYNTFNNTKILDDFIKVNGGNPSTPISREKSPISSFISVPEPQKRPKSILSNGSTYRHQQPPSEPYVIPINVTKTDSMYTTPRKEPVQNIEYVRVNQENNVIDDTVIITDTIEPESKTKTGVENEPVQRKSVLKKKPEALDGGVLIHVDNLSLPPLSSRTSDINSSIDTASNRSVIGSTPGNLTPERRDSGAAIISTEPIVDRHSANAYVLPGSSPEDSSVLFVP